MNTAFPWWMTVPFHTLIRGHPRFMSRGDEIVPGWPSVAASWRRAGEPLTVADYVQLGDVRRYYEEEEQGAPLVLLHHGGANSRVFGSKARTD